jgi:hypothetical protein
LKNIKPIHKFNGGRGATLCHKCNKMITEGLSEDLYCEECSGVPTHAYKLIREGDGRTCNGNKIGWILWNEDGTFKELLEQPQVGASCIVDPNKGPYYTWLTTSVQSFIEEGEEITFNTKNSKYKLICLKK